LYNQTNLDCFQRQAGGKERFLCLPGGTTVEMSIWKWSPVDCSGDPTLVTVVPINTFFNDPNYPENQLFISSCMQSSGSVSMNVSIGSVLLLIFFQYTWFIL
jgi:hypothetical protein